jgi:hypothetical protein
MKNRLLTAALSALSLIALTAPMARSEWYGHRDHSHRDHRPRHRSHRGFSGQIYIQGNERTVIRERTTVIGPGGDGPTVILRESEIVQPGQFGGRVIYGGDRYQQRHDDRYDYRYDPFYRRTVERHPIVNGIVPIAPVFRSGPIFQTCLTQIDGTSNCR